MTTPNVTLTRRDLTELTTAVCELPAGITADAALATLSDVLTALTDREASAMTTMPKSTTPAVSVQAAPVSWGWPQGTVAVLVQHGEPDRATRATVKRWCHYMGVNRHQAAMALSMAGDLHEDMTVIEVAAAILTVYQALDSIAVLDAAQWAAKEWEQCSAQGVRPSPEQRRAYRRYWPHTARTALCLALADRLLSSTVDGEA